MPVSNPLGSLDVNVELPLMADYTSPSPSILFIQPLHNMAENPRQAEAAEAEGVLHKHQGPGSITHKYILL